jgi:hypothetical protein
MEHLQNITFTNNLKLSTMKTHCVLAICAALAFAACQKDSDLARPLSGAPDVSLAGKVDVSPEAAFADNNASSAADKCMEVSTTNWLSGYGEFTPLHLSDLNEDKEYNKVETRGVIPTGIYVIEATGEGISETFARSNTDLKLTFNTRTHKITGQLTTKFYNGEVLVQNIDGDAKVTTDRIAMYLVARVDNAHIQMGSERLDLDYGEILLVLPVKPEGWFETNLYTTGVFCFPEKF